MDPLIPEIVGLDKWGWAMNIPHNIEKIPIYYEVSPREERFFIYQGKVLLYRSSGTGFLEEVPFKEKILGLATSGPHALVAGEENLYILSCGEECKVHYLGPKQCTRYYFVGLDEKECTPPYVVCFYDNKVWCAGLNRECTFELGVLPAHAKDAVNGAYCDGSVIHILKDDFCLFHFSSSLKSGETVGVCGKRFSRKCERPIRLKPCPFPLLDCSRSP